MPHCDIPPVRSLIDGPAYPSGASRQCSESSFTTRGKLVEPPSARLPMSKCRAFSELLGCAGLGLALAGCAGITYGPTAPVRPTITTQPSNQAVGIGQTATCTVAAAGTPPLSYQWQKNNANIAGATLSAYTTPATIASDNGATFDVVVTNSAASVTSASATLTVSGSSAIAITAQPASQSVTIGQTATFSVTATSGTLPLNYQWQKNNANIAGATLSAYTTPAKIASDNGATN